MGKVKVLILGSTGMLGAMVVDYLSTKNNLKITVPSRGELDGFSYDKYDWIINCIGIIKQKLHDPEEAIIVNGAFPYGLSRLAPKAKIIQIATDCVYEGSIGNYVETDSHDARDIYGKSKSLGEVNNKNFYNIRCSIVGIDRNEKSLLSWFLSQKKNSVIDGYANHLWNGITTLHFAKLCYAIIKNKTELPNVLHFIPKDTVTKYELLNIFAKVFDRQDIRIITKVGKMDINRTLKTTQPNLNTTLWQDMGYRTSPTIEYMVEELAKYIKV